MHKKKYLHAGFVRSFQEKQMRKIKISRDVSCSTEITLYNIKMTKVRRYALIGKISEIKTPTNLSFLLFAKESPCQI